MRWFISLTIYRILLPLVFLAAFPGWLMKMLRRGGLGTALGERVACYGGSPDFEPCAAVHVHAISVGEVILALKLIRCWREEHPEQRFVLAVGTATGHHVAVAAAVTGVRVVYAPLDLPIMVRRYLDRFEPACLVLIEGEIWPHMMLHCRKRGIPVTLVNARVSPRSARRYRKFAAWLRPLFSLLDGVAVQQEEDREFWKYLGVPTERIHHTGSLKFDPLGGGVPKKREEFAEMLDSFGPGRPVVLAASTHAGEESWLVSVIRTAVPGALPVIVPRHAERRDEVKRDLEGIGCSVLLRTQWFNRPAGQADVFVIDSTGELRDWTAHAGVVIIGKSFHATGGQNPTEAILAGIPVVFGPHMENFEPLASSLVEAGACIRAKDESGLSQALQTSLDPGFASTMVKAARRVISEHEGAARRVMELFSPVKKP